MLPSAQDKHCDYIRFSFRPCQLHITQMGFCELKDSSAFVSSPKSKPQHPCPVATWCAAEAGTPAPCPVCPMAELSWLRSWSSQQGFVDLHSCH